MNKDKHDDKNAQTKNGRKVKDDHKDVHNKHDTKTK